MTSENKPVQICITVDFKTRGEALEFMKKTNISDILFDHETEGFDLAIKEIGKEVEDDT
jgi:hypothetical protein